MTENIVNDIAERAAERAIKKYEAAKNKDKTKRDLHNVDKLLHIYTALNYHVENSVSSVYDSSIEELEYEELNLQLESIRRSKIRTMLLTENINIALEQLRKDLKAKNEEYKLELLKDYYFKNIKINELLIKYSCEKSAAYKWIKQVKEKLATHIFGVEYYII